MAGDEEIEIATIPKGTVVTKELLRSALWRGIDEQLFSPTNGNVFVLVESKRIPTGDDNG